MELIHVVGSVVRSHGASPARPLPAEGCVSWAPVARGKFGGAARSRGPVSCDVVGGVMEPAWLVPGWWWVAVAPDDDLPWEPVRVEISEEVARTVEVEVDGEVREVLEVDLGELSPDDVVDGQPWLRGRGVAGVRDLGGAFALTLTDGSETEPITIPGSSGAGPVEVVTDGDGRWTLTTPAGELAIATDGDGRWQIGA